MSDGDGRNNIVEALERAHAAAAQAMARQGNAGATEVQGEEQVVEEPPA